jgi:hypothetical protein
MRLKDIAAAIAIGGALALLAQSAQTEPTKTRAAVDVHGHSIVVSRAKNQRATTHVIIRKRSHLDPGTETFPGEHGDHDYAQTPTQHASSVLDNTNFGGNMTALPGPFTLLNKNSLWLQY